MQKIEHSYVKITDKVLNAAGVLCHFAEKQWGRIRGRYLLAGEFNPVFLERDKRPIQRRISKIPPGEYSWQAECWNYVR